MTIEQALAYVGNPVVWTDDTVGAVVGNLHEAGGVLAAEVRHLRAREAAMVETVLYKLLLDCRDELHTAHAEQDRLRQHIQRLRQALAGTPRVETLEAAR